MLEVKNPRAAGLSRWYWMPPMLSLLVKADGQHRCVLFLQLSKQLELLVLILHGRDNPGSAWGSSHTALSCSPFCVLPHSVVHAANGCVGQS